MNKKLFFIITCFVLCLSLTVFFILGSHALYRETIALKRHISLENNALRNLNTQRGFINAMYDQNDRIQKCKEEQKGVGCVQQALNKWFQAAVAREEVEKQAQFLVDAATRSARELGLPQ